MASQVPADWQDKVMHGSLTIGDQVLMAGDVAPERYEEPKGFSLSLQMKNTSEPERVDRFGIPWLMNCDGSDGTAEP